MKFGFYVEFKSERFFDILADAKHEAQENHSIVPLPLGPDSNYYYNCHPTGKSGGYAFHISRADVDVFISTRKNYLQTPNIWVDIGSASCWSPGYREVIHYISKLINLWDGRIHRNSISEVHLCTDFIGLDIDQLGIQFRKRWITRANKFHSYSDCTRFSGISLDQTEGTLQLTDKDDTTIETGISVGQGDISLRIYDKVFEIKRNGSKQSLPLILAASEMRRHRTV